MSRDYYTVLGVSRQATKDDIRQAYKRLAVQTHPDKNKNDPKAEEKFKEVSEAYSVLHDDRKRKVYDQFGHRGLSGSSGSGGSGGSGGFGGSGGSGGSSHFSAGVFSSQDANDLFSQMFGFGSPPTMRSGFGNFSHLFGSLSGSMPGTATPLRRQTTLQKDPTIHRKLPVSLEDLYHGKTKRLKLTRTVHGRQTSKTIEIPIRPGLKAGTKFTFENEGDQIHGHIPADIVFTLEEVPHGLFRRKDDNLLFTQKILLSEALVGATVSVPSLHGDATMLTLSHITCPGHERRLVGKGMPKKHGGYGDMIVTFKIIFPTHLTVEQKEGIKMYLP